MEKLPIEFWNNNKGILNLTSSYSDFSGEIHTLKNDDLDKFLKVISNSSLEEEPNKEKWLSMGRIVSPNISAIQARKKELREFGLI